MRIPIVTLAVAALAVGSGVPAQASAPAKLVDASPSTTRAVIALANEEIGGNRPDYCFRVKVAASNHRWATWTFSNRAVTAADTCQPFDSGASFYVRRNGTWMQAGGFTGTGFGSTCEWEIRPPAAVARDFGC